MIRKCAQLVPIALAGVLGASAFAQIRPTYDPNAPAAPATGAMTRGLETDQKIGAFLPMELRFTNADGKQVRLGDLFDLEKGSENSGGKHRPVLIAMVYYDCPVVCSATMDKLAGAFRRLDYKIGKDFKVAYFSIDSMETPARAKEVRDAYIVGHPDGLGDAGKLNPVIAENWNFFTGTAAANRELANALGFQYRATDNGQFAHSSVFMIVTPDGRIARYLSPFLGDEQQLADQTKLALLEASNGKIARGVSELMMMWCFMYDPKAGAYTLEAIRVMQIGGVIAIVAVGSLVSTMLIAERVRRRRLDGRGPDSNSGADSGNGGGGAGDGSAGVGTVAV